MVDEAGTSSGDGVATEPKRIVGLGASAGGLEALEEFFAHMPSNTGLAFVVVQHLSPDFRSLMDELLARRTNMAVHRVEHGVRVQPNEIYVIPPKQELRLVDGKLLLKERDSSHSLSLPIDIFFGSLADAAGDRAIAVVLSGSGSDGSRGVCKVHEAGGRVLVQTPETAKFDGMPNSALESGVVDATGAPAELPQLVLRLSRKDWKPGPAAEEDEGWFAGVLDLLKQEHGLDFAHYKPSTIRRRVDRRRLLSRIVDAEGYLERLKQDPNEVQALYWDLLIGVTHFFRDREAFEYLRQEILPQLIQEADPEQGLRVWVAGCATGEEAYSLAILFREELAARRASLSVKIFATDAHRTSLETAATGRYSADSIADLGEDLIKRHFKAVGDQFQVVPELRNMVVFASHDILRDAPFTKLDLVTCRNLLIYLKTPAQRTALSLMHFGLRFNGLLFLGPSETPGELSSEFDTINRRWKVFRKRRDVPLATRLSVGAAPVLGRSAAAQPPASKPQETRLQRTQQTLLDKHAPPSILVDPNLMVLYTFCGGGAYLEHSDGKPSLNVLDMVNSELKLTLNAALKRAQKTRADVSYGSIRTTHDQKLNLHIAPIHDADGCCYLISIREERQPQDSPSPRANLPEISKERIEDLEQELSFTRENLQATLEEMETANEELQATNEELVASNEELQSTNEELHSVNEELFTVNAEHQRKIDLLTELTEDMENLFAATDVGTVFLDKELRIRRFTPRVAELFQLLPQDAGRPISGFAHSLIIPELLADMKHVLRTEQPTQRQAPDNDGRWFLVRVTPYRVGKTVDGVVLSFVDITELKETEARLQLMSQLFKDVADPVIIEDISGAVVDMNPEAERVYGFDRDELLGQPGLMLVPDGLHEDEAELRRQCREYEYVRNAETLRRDKYGRIHPALVTLSRVRTREGEDPLIATITKDITLRKQAEQSAREAVRRRDEFLAMLSHELRNPLSVIQNAALLLASGELPEKLTSKNHQVILRQVKHMASLLGDLLDVSRVTQGKVELQRERVDLRATMREAVEGVMSAIEKRNQRLDVSAPEHVVVVLGDGARLRQIQENLLTNASKYTPDGGRIHLELTASDDEALIRVSDTGRGIDPHQLETIFDLFTQVDPKLDRADGGMGVGLTLVRTLVSLHGGTVRAFSHGQNKGSVFEVRLPLALADGAEVHDGESRHGEQPAQSGEFPRPAPRDVMIVEDNQDAREVLKMLLELDGHRVRVANDGLSGLQSIRRYRPDVALVDIGLPELDGYELARRVRDDREHPPPLLVALSGYGRPEDERAVQQAGFSMLLVKPVSQQRLRNALALQGRDASTLAGED